MCFISYFIVNCKRKWIEKRLWGGGGGGGETVDFICEPEDKNVCLIGKLWTGNDG